MGDEEQTSEPVAQPSTLASKEYYSAKFLEHLKKHTSTPPLNAIAAEEVTVGEYADWNFAKDAVDAIAAEMSYKVAQSLDALAAIMSPNPPAIKPVKKVIHRQTRLFEDERPRENWGYQIEIRIRYAATERESGVQTLQWTEWDIVRMDHAKAFHRSKVRALKVLAQKLKRIPAYANPEYFQWRVVPFYMSRTWRERIQQKAATRARGMAVKKAAREQQLQNAIEMREAEGAKYGANVIHKGTPPKPCFAFNPLPVSPLVEGSVSDALNVTLSYKTWAASEAEVHTEAYAKADAIGTVKLYGVHGPLTLSPEEHATLLAAKHSGPYIGDCPFPV